VLIVLLLTCIVGCNRSALHNASAQTPPAAGKAVSVEEKVDLLREEFPEAKVQLDRDRARVARILGLKGKTESIPTESTRADDLARSILRNPTVAAALGLSPDLRELCDPVSRQDTQLADYAIVRMRQCVDGVRVFGAELVMSVRVKPSPAIDTLTSSLRPDVPRSVTPAVTAAAASQAAVAVLKGRGSPESSRGAAAATAAAAPPELVIFVPALLQLEGQPRLCWLVRRQSVNVFVDARTGSIVHQYSEVHHGSIQ
jgi:hypothetical protein